MTSTVVDVDSIEIMSLVFKQLSYANAMETTDLVNGDYGYQGYFSPPNKFRFHFRLNSTHFHITEEGQVAEIEATFEVTYVDGAQTKRRRLDEMRETHVSQGDGGKMLAQGAFSIFSNESEIPVSSPDNKNFFRTRLLFLSTGFIAFVTLRHFFRRITRKRESDPLFLNKRTERQYNLLQGSNIF